jgi:hypothetical protein
VIAPAAPEALVLAAATEVSAVLPPDQPVTASANSTGPTGILESAASSSAWSTAAGSADLSATPQALPLNAEPTSLLGSLPSPAVLVVSIFGLMLATASALGAFVLYRRGY